MMRPSRGAPATQPRTRVKVMTCICTVTFWEVQGTLSITQRLPPPDVFAEDWSWGGRRG